MTYGVDKIYALDPFSRLAKTNDPESPDYDQYTRSITGHAYFQIGDDSGNSSSYGFQPAQTRYLLSPVN